MKHLMTIKKLVELTGRHVDTFYKIKRGVSTPSPKLAKILEDETGISRLRWLYPDEFGSPWDAPALITESGPEGQKQAEGADGA